MNRTNDKSLMRMHTGYLTPVKLASCFLMENFADLSGTFL